MSSRLNACELQIKLMSSDIGKQSTQTLWPGASQFGVSLYPPPGQSTHTITPACQRREPQGSPQGRVEEYRLKEEKCHEKK